MHILLLNDDPPEAANSVSTIVRNLQKIYKERGCKVTVISTHRKEESHEIKRTENIISLPVSYRQSLRQYCCLYMPSVSKILKTLLEELRPDVVHAHNIHGYVTYSALKIARSYTPNVYITMHDVMSISYVRLATKRYLDSRGQNCHLTPLDHIKAAELQYNPIRNTIIRKILNTYVRRVICPSRALEYALNTHHIKNTIVIPNGIDTNEWIASQEEIDEFKEKHGLHDKKIILFGGRLSVDKGAIPLLHALNLLRTNMPSVLLFVAGSPERWRGLVKMANMPDELHKHIYNPGWMNRNDVRLANFAADVVTTPSLCLDVFPSTNLEAMAAGKPVVGTCFGGTQEVVEHGKTGLIVNPGNENELHEALLNLLQDDALRSTYGAAGKQHVTESYTLQKQGKDYLDLFTAV